MTDQTLDSRLRSDVLVTSFESFFRSKSADVYRALFASLGNADLAQEATSEAFSRAFDKWDVLRDYKNPAGWVYRVGLNWGISRLRRLRFRDSRPVPDIPESDAVPIDPSLINAIRRLNRSQIEVVVLRYFFDLDQEAIATILGIPIGTIRSRLSRALSRLEQSLSHYQGDAE